MAVVNDEYIESVRAAQAVRILGSLELATELRVGRRTDEHGTTWCRVECDGQSFEALGYIDALAQCAQWLTFERPNEPVPYVLTELATALFENGGAL